MSSENLLLAAPDDELRERALKRLKKRRDFHTHLLIYALVNGFTTSIWFILGADGFFWPVFLIGLWGIGLVMNAWDVYGDTDFSEDTVRREMAKLREGGRAR